MSDKTKENNKNIEVESLQRVQNELEKANQQAQEYLDNWKRERADFINYKKDEIKRLGEFVKFANEAIILEVIEVLDDLEKAAKEINNEGLDQILKKFQDLLKKYDVERVKVEGEKFNPLFHEAVAAPSGALGEGREGMEGGELEEIRAGYMMHGKVIRPARVKILSKN